MSVVGKVESFFRVLNEAGPREAVKRTGRVLNNALWHRVVHPTYRRTVREILPRRITVANGVVTRDYPPMNAQRKPLYEYLRGVASVALLQRPHVIADIEDAAVRNLERFTESDDHVVIVGGGRGITAVVAARHVGDSGSVTVFEPSLERVRQVRETTELNRVAGRVSVERTVVGELVRMWGVSSSSDSLRPEEIPSCDVLEMDCEGCEIAVLEGLTVRPRVLIVETHGAEDPVENEVTDLLTGLGYDVVDVDEENVDYGSYVVTAVHGSRGTGSDDPNGS